MTFYRTKEDDGNEIAVTVSVADYSDENYLGWYEAVVYTEKEGRIADFFNKTFKE